MLPALSTQSPPALLLRPDRIPDHRERALDHVLLLLVHPHRIAHDQGTYAGRIGRRVELLNTPPDYLSREENAVNANARNPRNCTVHRCLQTVLLQLKHTHD